MVLCFGLFSTSKFSVGKNSVFSSDILRHTSQVLFLGEPARRGRRFQASRNPFHEPTLGNVSSSRRAVGLSVTMILPSIPYVRMIIRIYNPLSDNVLQSETGKKHFHFYPSRNPRRGERVQQPFYPPPERFPVSGFAPEGAEQESGGAFPTELLSLSGHHPIAHSSVFIVSSPIHRPFITNSSQIHRSFVTHSSHIHLPFIAHSSHIHRPFIAHSSVFIVSSPIPFNY